MPPPDGIGAVVLLKISPPKAMAVEIISRQNTVTEMHDDHFAVGDRRGAGHVL